MLKEGSPKTIQVVHFNHCPQYKYLCFFRFINLLKQLCLLFSVNWSYVSWSSVFRRKWSLRKMRRRRRQILSASPWLTSTMATLTSTFPASWQIYRPPTLLPSTVWVCSRLFCIGTSFMAQSDYGYFIIRLCRIVTYRVFIKYCVFSWKCCDFSELCQFCCSAGVLPALMSSVYTMLENR